MSSIGSLIKQFKYYQLLGEKTFEQIGDDQLNWQYNTQSNSIGVIIQHLNGNMLSRFTDFLTSDGEKTWRNRETEFEEKNLSRSDLMNLWQKGWDCLFKAIGDLTDEDLGRIVLVRNQQHTVEEAINRQLAHYAYHIGQIVYIGRMAAGDDWKSLSIPKGQSGRYNAKKMGNSVQKGHYTDDLLEAK